MLEKDFWDMDVGEVVRYIEHYNKRKETQMKEQAFFDYQLANLIGISVSRIYSKQAKLPSIEEAYSTIFNIDDNEQQRIKEKKSITNFINFASTFNKRFKGGNNN